MLFRSRMLKHMGFMKLADHEYKESIDEMKHAEKIIERLLFLDAIPKMDYLPLNVGQTVRAQLEADLKLEINAVTMYNKAAKAAHEAGDAASAELFRLLLKDEEAHVDWLEAQMHQIKEIGYEIYLTTKVGGSEE